MNKTEISVLTVLGIAAIVSIISSSSTVMSTDNAEDNLLGSLDVQNISPEVIGVWIETTAGVAEDNLDCWVYYDFIIQVRDNNKLTDLENIVLTIYENSSTKGAADSERSHYTFMYAQDTNTWSEIGPDGTSPYDHIDTANCVQATETNTEDNYEFRIRVGKQAKPTMDSEYWIVWWDVTDDSDATASDNTDNFNVKKYIEISLDHENIYWTSIAPGQSDQACDNNPITATVYSNGAWEMKLKASSNWSYNGETIDISNTKYWHTDAVASASTVSTSYPGTTISDWQNIAYTTTSKQIYLWQTVPGGQAVGTYTTTFWVLAQHV